VLNQSSVLEVAVRGHRLEAVWLGPPAEAGPSFVLLHEGLGSVSLWRDFPARLAEATGFGVLVYSRLGYGGSDPAPLPRPLTYLEDEARVTLPAVLEQAGIKDCVLLGHSDGGSIAALYAGLHADPRVRGVVLIAPHFFVEEVSLSGIRMTDAAFESGELRARLARHHRANSETAYRGWRDLWLDPRFRDWNAAAALNGLDAPTLIIQGQEDAYGSLEQIRFLESRAQYVETLILPAYGHAPHLERPDVVLPAIARFVARIANTRR
jgi:pimeloyl-ACP methyl ester carboxylesterase